MNTRIWIGLAAATALMAIAVSASAQLAPAPSGEAVFNARCKACHDPAVERAPGRAELAIRPRADIVAALTTGMMAPMAKGMTPDEIQAVAAYLTSGPPTTTASSRGAVNRTGVDKLCAVNGPIHAGAGDWASMGLDAASTRYQPRPGLRAADVPRLKLKWAFAMPGGGQPTVVGDWLFVTNRGGKFYALDAKTGCVHWAAEGASSRTTPMVIRSKASPSGWASFIGVGGRAVQAFDAQTGKVLWKSESLDAHPAAGITGTPVVSGNQLFVPITSGEEGSAIQKTYPCCSFRGSLAALDLMTGHKQWQTYMISEPLHPTHKNALGVQMQGPAGAAIWAAPTVDAKRGLVYVVTGDSYTDVETKGDDAVVALTMKTGKIRWSHQVTADDNYVMSCDVPGMSANCPSPRGPDYDFGAAPVLFSLQDGHQVLAAGQKSGIVYGFDPDNGRLKWKTQVGDGSALGGVEWGIGADRTRIFVPIADVIPLFNEAAIAHGLPASPGYKGPGKPGLYALYPASGHIVWSAPAPVAPCKYAGDRSRDYAGAACIRGQSAAPGMMPGVVFSGTLDGWLRAYSATTGKVVWAYSTTAQTYDTVNGVKTQPGGGIDGMGPTIAGGMVYSMSGFNGAARTGGNGVNVLLAFSVDGK